MIVKIAQVLFYLNTLIWIILGIISLARVTDGYPEKAVMATIIGLMMFGNALLMLLSGLWIGKARKVSFFFALSVLAINILLTFTDQFGWYDFGTLMIDLIILGLMFAARRWYF